VARVEQRDDNAGWSSLSWFQPEAPVQQVVLVVLNEHSQLVHASGCDPDLLGVHYFRKGPLTVLSSGSTAGPTSGAIHQRAGWSQGKVNNTYILFERAGDELSGRILAGLNIHQHTFAVLPPQFGVRAPQMM
jgi:hypothetical protein